jgi:hypothetical protein
MCQLFFASRCRFHAQLIAGHLAGRIANGGTALLRNRRAEALRRFVP